METVSSLSLEGFKSFTDEVATSVIAQKEEFLRSLLDRLIPGWKLEDIGRRCKWVRHAGSAIEYLHVDGNAVLEMHPIEFETVRDGQSHKMKVSWKYRDLSAHSAGDGNE